MNTRLFALGLAGLLTACAQTSSQTEMEQLRAQLAEQQTAVQLSAERSQQLQKNLFRYVFSTG